MRFVAVILNPGRVWTDHVVIDMERKSVVATCSMEADADRIAAALNKCVVRKTEPDLLPYDVVEGTK